jgi:hypothetical protein
MVKLIALAIMHHKATAPAPTPTAATATGTSTVGNPTVEDKRAAVGSATRLAIAVDVSSFKYAFSTFLSSFHCSNVYVVVCLPY